MGVTERDLVRRLRAWSVGGPVARGETIQTAIAPEENRLVLAFVRMGGESRPWAVMWKKGLKRPQFRFAADGRNRELVDYMLLDLTEDLASAMWHPSHWEPYGTENESDLTLENLPQVWVPNGSHLDMLHLLAYAYARRKGSADEDEALSLLGRSSLRLFLESRRPGQQLVVNASRAVRSAFDFPCEDFRQAHLGLLMAWLDHRGDRDAGRAAAREAEQMPVSTSLRPQVERQQLAALVEAFNDARKAGDSRSSRSSERAIAAVLRSDLERRIDLVERAIGVLESDDRDPNPGLGVLVNDTMKNHYFEYIRPEERGLIAGKRPWVPSPETDFEPRSAIARYFSLDAAADLMRSTLIHYDRELEAEAINAGSAFRGTITKVEIDQSVKPARTVWHVEDPSPGPLSLRQWDQVCVVGRPDRVALIREIVPTSTNGLVLELQIEKGIREKPGIPWPHRMVDKDPSWLGLSVTVTATSFHSLTLRKRMLLGRDKDGAGGWILDVGPLRRAERNDAADADREQADAG